MQRGFESSLIRSSIPSDTFQRETRAALHCLRLKFRAGAEARKMMQHLYTRGFDSSAMRAAIDAFQQENNTEE
jgi:regulatory protein